MANDSLFKQVADAAAKIANETAGKTMNTRVPQTIQRGGQQQGSGQAASTIGEILQNARQRQLFPGRQPVPTPTQQQQQAIGYQATPTINVENQSDKKDSKKDSDKDKAEKDNRNNIGNIGMTDNSMFQTALSNADKLEPDQEDAKEQENQIKASVETRGSQELENMIKEAMEEGKKRHDERIEAESQNRSSDDTPEEESLEINGLTPNQAIKDQYMQEHPLTMLQSPVPYLADNASDEQKQNLANRFGFENYDDYSKYYSDFGQMRNSETGERGIESTRNLLEAPIYSTPGFQDIRDDILENLDKREDDLQQALDDVTNGKDGKQADDINAALGGIYGDLTASDWDDMTQRQQFMWAFANDEDLRNQLAAINEGFSSDNALGDYDEASKNYSGNAYETFRGLDQDELTQAVNAIYGLWDDDDTTGLRGWGDYLYGDTSASDMDAAAIAAYMIENGIDPTQYVYNNDNYDYRALGNDPVTMARMAEYITMQDPEVAQNVFSDVYNGNNASMSDIGLDKNDMLLLLLADYQNKYGYIGNEDPTDLNYLLSLGGEKNPLRSTSESDETGRKKDYSQRQNYNAMDSWINPYQTVMDANGNPQEQYRLGINPWTDNQGDNPLADMYLSDTFAAQYADKYKGKQLVQ